MNYREWQAARMNHIINGGQAAPDMLTTVYNIIYARRPSHVKREEIVDQVAVVTGISKGPDLDGAVQDALKHLLKRHRISRVSHGIYCCR